ncbi:MAG: hypothetical protein WBF48_01055 [Halarcobacter sp.]
MDSIDILKLVTPLVSILIASLVALFIHWKNKKIENVNTQLNNLYLKLNCIIEKEYRFLKLNTPDESDSNELIKKYTIEYLTFFENLRNCYFENMLYSSHDLNIAFNSLNKIYNVELNGTLKFKNIDNIDTAKENISTYLFHQDDRFIEKLDDLIGIVSEDIYNLKKEKPLKTFF